MKISDYLKETPSILNEIINRADKLFEAVRTETIKKIIITGSGTSYHAGVQVQAYMQKHLGISIQAVYPFAVTKDFFAGADDETLFIGISQGGSSYSTYRAMQLAKEHHCKVASMAGMENALIDEAADVVLTVQCGEEKVGAKTKGFYSTKLQLMLLALEIARETKRLSAEGYAEEIQAIKEAVNKAEGTLKASEKWIEKNQSVLKEAAEIRIIGTADFYGDTLESALKLLETLRIPVTGYEFEEFVHGIYNAVNENSTIIILDSGNEKRISKLVEVLSQWTDKIYSIGPNVEENGRNFKLDLGGNLEYQTFHYIIPLQLICDRIPPLNGVDPGVPKDPKFHMKLESKKINH